MPNSPQQRFEEELARAVKAETNTECAIAFRAATAILYGVKMDWPKFIASRKSIDGGSSNNSGYGPQAPLDPAEVRALLEKAMRGTDPKSSFYDLLLSFEQQFNDRGSLSPRQMETLRKSAARAG